MITNEKGIIKWCWVLGLGEGSGCKNLVLWCKWVFKLFYVGCVRVVLGSFVVVSGGEGFFNSGKEVNNEK